MQDLVSISLLLNYFITITKAMAIVLRVMHCRHLSTLTWPASTSQTHQTQQHQTQQTIVYNNKITSQIHEQNFDNNKD